eukprot:9193701-Alexandrium_andersonii.AAC.1
MMRRGPVVPQLANPARRPVALLLAKPATPEVPLRGGCRPLCIRRPRGGCRPLATTHRAMLP